MSTASETSGTALRVNDPAVCPYCMRRPTGLGTDVYSDDHIFMQAMGGRKTIRACKTCNDQFGATFEAENLKKLIMPLSILLAQKGVALAASNLKWENAVSAPDGHRYNLRLDKDGVVRTESAKLVVDRDSEDPKLLHVYVNDDPDSRKLLRAFQNKKKFAFNGKIPNVRGRPQKSIYQFDLPNQVGLAALKMAYAASTLMFPDEITNLSEARLDLRRNDDRMRAKSIIFDHRVHSTIDSSRDPLCHMIYVEEYGRSIHGIVQFFGSFQAYVRLSGETSRTYPHGLVATLNPISGQESFHEVPRLEVLKWTGDEFADQLSMVKKFNSDARSCGALSDPLDVRSVFGDDGIERVVKPSIPGFSWTGDVPGRLK